MAHSPENRDGSGVVGRIYRLAKQDLLLVLKDRSAVVWLILLPIVFATFFGMVMGKRSDPRDASARLTVVNEDSGFLSLALLSQLKGEGLELVEIAPERKEKTKEKIRTLVIPHDFTARVGRGDKVTLRLEKEPDTNAEAALVVEARIYRAITRVLATLIEMGAYDIGKDSINVVKYQEAMATKDQVRVDSDYAGEARVIPDGFAQSIPGNVVMFVMLITMTYGAAAISAERSTGILRRLATGPLSSTEIVLGKILGRLAIALFQIGVLMVVGFLANRFLGVYIGNDLFGVLLVLLAYALAVAPIGIFFGGWFTNPDHAASLGVIGTLIMAAFGGCWWPLEIVSKHLRIVGHIFPTAWAMDSLHQVISFGRGPGDVVLSMLVLVGYSGLFTLLATRSLRID
jgi:ABC-2 type transport system permease protein